MPARKLSGRKVARHVRTALKERVTRFADRHGLRPCLATVLVGEDPASLSYVGAKQRTCRELGMLTRDIRLPADLATSDLVEAVQDLGQDSGVHGILVQLPLPQQVDPAAVIRAIPPEKDVDGFHPENVGLLWSGRPRFVPCTPAGILELLRFYDVPIAGRHVVVVGRSDIVGKPLAGLLLQKGADATVTVCHSKTRNLAAHTRQADILVAAMGRPKALNATFVQPGAVVVDVGVNRVGTTESGKAKLCGDVDESSVRQVASALTPVPGGVGPMTITMLMANTLRAAELAVAET